MRKSRCTIFVTAVIMGVFANPTPSGATPARVTCGGLGVVQRSNYAIVTLYPRLNGRSSATASYVIGRGDDWRRLPYGTARWFRVVKGHIYRFDGYVIDYYTGTSSVCRYVYPWRAR